METDKEYKLRCLCSDILDYVEDNTNDLDDLCDCQDRKGIHEKDCKTSLMRLDFSEFRSKLEKLQNLTG